MDAPAHPALAGVAPTMRRLSPGSMLFRQGDATRGVFRLLSGGIRLLRVTPDGIEVPMHTVRPGELFAEASLFSASYHCDAVAHRESDVLIYPRSALTGRLREDPDALWAFATELAQRVQGLRMRIEVGRTRSADERLLQYLRLHADRTGRWRPAGTLKQLAPELGLTHEALYRALARLERDGRILRSGREIELSMRAPASR